MNCAIKQSLRLSTWLVAKKVAACIGTMQGTSEVAACYFWFKKLRMNYRIHDENKFRLNLFIVLLLSSQQLKIKLATVTDMYG